MLAQSAESDSAIKLSKDEEAQLKWRDGGW